MSQIIDSKWKGPLLFFAFFSLLAALMSLFSLVRYETNDDIGFILLASGQYTGQPEPNLVFVGIPMGFLISSLYRVFPLLEWYTATLVGLQVLSFTVIATLGTRRWNEHRFLSFIFLLLLASFEIVLLTKLQFTTTAAVSATAGLLCLIQAPRYGSLPSLLGLVLIFAGLGLRFESAALSLAIATPLLLTPRRDSPESYRNLLTRRFALLAICSTLSVGANSLCFHAYQLDPAWQNYTQYNLVRGRIHARELEESLAPKSVTLRDYHLFRHFIQDPSLTTKDLDVLDSELGERTEWSWQSSGPKIWPYLPVIFSALATLVCLSTGGDSRFRLALFLSGSLFTVLVGFLSLGLIFKQRVFLSALFPCVIVPLALWLLKGSTPKKHVVTGLVLCLCALGFYTTGSALRTTMRNRAERAHWKASIWPALQTFLSSDSRNAVVVAGALALENLDPWKVSLSLPVKRLVWTGWLTGSPYNIGRYDSFPQAADSMVFMSTKSQMKEAVPYLVEALEIAGKKISFHPLPISSDELFILEAIPTQTPPEPETPRQGKPR